MIEEIAFLGDAKNCTATLNSSGVSKLGHFRARPAVEFSFLAFAVGIFGGIKSAFGMGHVAEHIADNIARDVGVAVFATDQVGSRYRSSNCALS